MDLSVVIDGNVKWYSHYGKIVRLFLKQAYTNLWPNNCTPGHLPREIKTSVKTKACTCMFTAAFL